MREPQTQGPAAGPGADADVAVVVEIGRKLLAVWETPRDRGFVPGVLPTGQPADGGDGVGRAAQNHGMDQAGNGWK